MKLKRTIKSFPFAFRGLTDLFKTENNFQIHASVAIAIVIAGFIFRLSALEWVLIVICIGLVMTAEAFNTVAEKLVNMISPGKSKEAGLIKDLAAGAVLMASMTSVIVGLIIFIPKLAGLL